MNVRSILKNFPQSTVICMLELNYPYQSHPVPGLSKPTDVKQIAKLCKEGTKAIAWKFQDRQISNLDQTTQAYLHSSHSTKPWIMEQFLQDYNQTSALAATTAYKAMILISLPTVSLPHGFS